MADKRNVDTPIKYTPLVYVEKREVDTPIKYNPLVYADKRDAKAQEMSERTYGQRKTSI